MISKILNSISDFSDKIEDGTIKVCFLHENSKVSKTGWAGFVKPEELYAPENMENNLGISLIGPQFPGDKILTCIDIDGDKRTIKGENVEQFSKDIAFHIIKRKLDEESIKYMAVKSSSGGYHLYLYTLIESLRYESTKGLIYPKNLNEIADEDLKMYLSGNSNKFLAIIDEEVPKSIVEIWCNKRYMVAPGSDIYDEDGTYIGTTELLYDGVQTFEEISTYKGNLNDLIRQAFLDNNFHEDKKINYSQPTIPDMNSRTFSPTLNDFDIKLIGDLLIEAYPKIDGEKHNATLALGGYFFNKNISYESVHKIGEYVIENGPENLFKSNQAFLDTLTHDIRENDAARQQTGLATFEEILSPYYEKERIGKQLHIATNPTFHKFWPDGRYSKRYNEIIINHKQNYIVKNIIQTSLSKEGDIIENKIQNHKINHSIEEIILYNDISDPEKKSDWEKPVQITFKINKKLEKSEIYQNPNDLFQKYRRLKGAYTDHAKTIIEAIYREYEDLGFIRTIDSSTRPGIWYDKQTKTIKKYIKKDNEMTEIQPEKPDKNNLITAINLLKQINQVLPWNQGKFGYLIKTGLTLPYADILKYFYSKHHKSIILYGEAGTLKSTIAELIMSFNMDPFIYRDFSIVSGGELNSEFRFGRAMDISSYPLIVNEAEYLFLNVKIRELIKDSVTGKLLRKPGGNNSQSYYSHRASIYTMNEFPMNTEDPAFIRRFVPLEFDQTEVCDTPEIKEKLEFLNKNGVKNYRFKELAAIGDYTFYILSKNLHWFDYSVEDIQDKIIKSIEEYTGENLDFLKQQSNDFVSTDRSDRENVRLTMVLEILKAPYVANKARFISDRNPITNVRDIISDGNAYPYINLINDDEILIDSGFKRKFNERYYKSGVSITVKATYNLLQDLDLSLDSMNYTTAVVQGRKKRVRGIRMTIEDFVKILTNKNII